MLFIDDLNRKIEVPTPPQKVISLCPSITETLIELDINVIGRTKFCIHPKEKIQQIQIVGGTKSVHYDRIHHLKPDLIICEKEENTPEIVETLEKQYPVYVVNVESWKDGLKMMTNFGKIFQQEKKIDEWLKLLPESPPTIVQKKRVAYLIWKEPLMTVGKTTYINDVLNSLGFINPFENRPERYPQISFEELQSAELDFLFLSSEPFPFKDKHIQEFKQNLPDVHIQIVDGEMFSWYGVRMIRAIDYFQNKLKEMLRFFI